MSFIFNQIKEVWLGLPLFVKAIILLLLILLVYYLVKKYSSWFKDKFQSSDINYKDGETPNNPGYTVGAGNVTQGQSILKELAQRLYNDIYDTPVVTPRDQDAYYQVYALSDADLKYLSQYYREILTKDTWLYEDMDDEVYAPLYKASDIMTRLSKIGEKKN